MISFINVSLFKGIVLRDFQPFIYLKTLPGTQINRLNRFCKIFRFCEDIRKNVLTRIVILELLKIFKLTEKQISKFENILKIVCQRCRGLRGNRVVSA